MSALSGWNVERLTRPGLLWPCKEYCLYVQLAVSQIIADGQPSASVARLHLPMARCLLRSRFMPSARAVWQLALLCCCVCVNGVHMRAGSQPIGDVSIGHGHGLVDPTATRFHKSKHTKSEQDGAAGASMVLCIMKIACEVAQTIGT